MTTIIQNWVCTKTGVSLNLEEKNVGKKLNDGLIYFKLIEFTTPGSGSVKQPKVPVSSSSEALSNLEMLCPWLKILGVNHSLSFLKKISQGDNEACLRMLYEIYLRVEDKSHVYLITKQREAYLLSKEESRFQVKKAPEIQTGFVDSELVKNRILEDPLVRNKTMILHYKYRKEKILQKCKQESARRIRKLALLDNQKTASHFEMTVNINPPKPPTECCIKWCESKKHVVQSPEQMYLFQKKKRILNMNKTTVKMFSSILQDLWSTLLSNEREDFENIVKSKLLKQSYEEKQLSIRWGQLHAQYKNFFQQSIITNEQTEPSGPILADIHPFKKVDEKKRLLELHCRLFEEVASNMEIETLSLCCQTVIDLVDYATLKSDYWRAHDNDVPVYVDFLWKELFYKGLPIEFEISNRFNIEWKYIKEKDIEMRDLQTKITDSLLDAIVDSYLKQEGLWSSYNEQEPLNNFGYIIHKLLHNKYPLPPDSPALKLPDFTIKVILADLLDSFKFDQMEKLLEAQNVILINVNIFTNYCLEKFEQEKSYYDQHAEHMMRFSDISELEEFIPRLRIVMNKETQFPPNDNEKPKYSYAGLLGKLAFETLNEGERLDDVLLVAMLGEYLKTLEGKRGFVLTGFPTTLYQVLVFEYFIMGKPLNVDIKKLDANMQLPVNSTVLLYLDNLVRSCIGNNFGFNRQSTGYPSSVIDHLDESAEEVGPKIRTKSEGTEDHRQYSLVSSADTFKHSTRSTTIFSENIAYSASKPWAYADSDQFRYSKILPNPSAEWPSKDSISQTYIDRYIAICTRNSYVKSEQNSQKNEKSSVGYKNCKTPSQKTNYIRNEGKGEQIYEQFDKVSKIYILELDVDTLTFISKLILDIDVDTPVNEVKQSIVSFGRFILNEKEIENTTKSKADSCEDIQYIPSPAYFDCKKLMRQTRHGKSIESDTFEQNYEPPISDSLPYVENPIPEKLQLAMVSIWEQVEKSYLEKLRESLSKYISIKAQWLPFRSHISQINEQCIQSVDERLQIVNNFQLMFNAVEMFARKVPAVKIELHYKVHELNNILFEIIESKRSSALQVKKALEDTQWVRNYRLLLTNSYLRLLQHEFDRTVDSLQIAFDYYTCMLGFIPENKIIPKVEIKPILLEEEDHIIKKKSKSYTSSLKKSASSAIEPPRDSSLLFSSGLTFVRGKIRSLQSFLSDVINLEKRSYSDKRSQSVAATDDSSVGNENKKLSAQPNEVKEVINKKQKAATRSNTISSKSFQGSLHRPSRRESKMYKTKSHDIEEQMLEDKIKTEWQNVVRIEIGRLTDIVTMIEEKACADIESAIQNANRLFEKFEWDIEECYKKEKQALNNIGDIFSAAIEDEVPIQPLLVFDNDKFFIDKSNLLFPDNPPGPPECLEEETDCNNFKIDQLEKLVVKLQSLSPNRIMRKTLGFILYDHFKSVEVPVHWKTLSKKRIDEILIYVYGGLDVVDWKVFILYATNIPFPTLEELLNLKRHFEEIDQEKTEVISKQQFFNTTLWFDREFSPSLQGDLHLILSKLLLLRIFEVSNSELNYKDFLLFFCKSETDKEGLMRLLVILNDMEDTRNKDCTVHAVIPVDAMIVAKQEFDRILYKAFNIMDNLEVKKLRRDIYENIFASQHDEYLETEMILAQGLLVPPSDRDSTGFEIEPQYEKKIHIFEEYKNCLPLYERFREPIWYKCLSYKLVLMIVMLALNLNFPSPDGINRQRHIEVRLKNLFREKGVNNYIQAYQLYESKFMQEIFETSFFFKTCNLDELLTAYTNDKRLHLQ